MENAPPSPIAALFDFSPGEDFCTLFQVTMLKIYFMSPCVVLFGWYGCLKKYTISSHILAERRSKPCQEVRELYRK